MPMYTEGPSKAELPRNEYTAHRISIMFFLNGDHCGNISLSTALQCSRSQRVLLATDRLGLETGLERELGPADLVSDAFSQVI